MVSTLGERWTVGATPWEEGIGPEDRPRLVGGRGENWRSNLGGGNFLLFAEYKHQLKLLLRDERRIAVLLHSRALRGPSLIIRSA
jgi:hypothetical protein